MHFLHQHSTESTEPTRTDCQYGFPVFANVSLRIMLTLQNTVMNTKSRVTFFTPTHRRDLERFRLLRESIERFGTDIHHVAVVDDEDLQEFHKLEFKNNLTLLSTAEVLPQRIEARRKARGYRRRDPRYWVSPQPIHGWTIQQIIKLSSPEFTDTPGIVVLDSDVVFLDKVVHSDFYASDGRLHLYERPHSETVETAEWFIRSVRFLSLPTSRVVMKQYTYAPVPIHRDVVLDLRRFMESRGQRSWIEAFHDAQIMEYSTLGVFSRYIDKLKRQCPVPPTLSVQFWVRDHMNDAERKIHEAVTSNGAKVALIQGNMGHDIGYVRDLVRSVWDGTVSMRGNSPFSNARN